MCIEHGRVGLARETEVLGENPLITNPTWAELFLTTSVNINSQDIFSLKIVMEDYVSKIRGVLFFVLKSINIHS